MLGQTMGPTQEISPVDHVHDEVPHNHDGDYSDPLHNHDADYSPAGHDHPHNHDANYEPLGHDHNAEYSPLAHHHDADYSPTGHGHAELHTHEGGASADGGGELGSAYVRMLDPFNFGGTTFVNMPGLEKTIIVANRPVIVRFETLIECLTLGGNCLPVFQVHYDGAFLEEFTGSTIVGQNNFVNITRSLRYTPPAGEHTFKIMVRTNSGQSARLPDASVHLLRITEV